KSIGNALLNACAQGTHTDRLEPAGSAPYSAAPAKKAGQSMGKPSARQNNSGGADIMGSHTYPSTHTAQTLGSRDSLPGHSLPHRQQEFPPGPACAGPSCRPGAFG